MKNQAVTGFEPRVSTRNMTSYRRESSFYQELALIDLDRGESVAEFRFYGPGATVYCVAWLNLWHYGIEASCRGMGKAGGYGYHKPSAAMGEALKDCGFTFAEEIHGVGDDAIRRAIVAIAEKVGIARPYIHYAHA